MWPLLSLLENIDFYIYSKMLLTCSCLKNQYFTIYKPKKLKFLNIAGHRFKDPSQFCVTLAKWFLSHFAMNISVISTALLFLFHSFKAFFLFSFKDSIHVHSYTFIPNHDFKGFYIIEVTLKLSTYCLWQSFYSKSVSVSWIFNIFSYNTIFDLIKII